MIRLIPVTVLTILGIALLQYGWNFMKPRKSALDDVLPTASFFGGFMLLLGAFAIIVWP